MHFVTYTSSYDDLTRCADIPEISEVLIEPELLACQGTLSAEETLSLATAARELDLKPILVWDTLKTESQLDDIIAELSKWDLSVFAAVRVRDIGAAAWITAHSPELPLHLIAETGNHNLEGLTGWCELFKGSIARLLLSIELPEERLIEYCQKLPVQCEVMGAGRICLFYSPRKLISLNFEEDDEIIEVTSSSDDSHGRPFPTVESRHGTLMYLDKDQFILDKLEGLASARMHSIRLDLRHLSSAGSSCSSITDLCNQIRSGAEDIRGGWPRPTLAPFFKTNKTTAQFSKLKSRLHVQRDESCLAQVVSTERGKLVAYYTLRAFNTNETFVAVLPTGTEVQMPNVQFKSVTGEPLDCCPPYSVITSKWLGKITPGTLIRSESQGG